MKKQLRSINGKISWLKRQKNELESKRNSLADRRENFEEEVIMRLVQNSLGELHSEDRGMMQENIDKIFSRMLELPEDERLLVANFLYHSGIISGCSGFGSYKSPTTCGGCHEGRKNVAALKLDHLVKFMGDRQYRIPREVFQQALSRVSLKYQSSLNQINAEIEKLDSELKKIREKLGSLKKEKELWQKLADTTDSISPSSTLFDFLLNFSKYIEEVKVVEPDIAVIQTSRSEWGGSGGIGYFDQITVYFYGQTEMEEWQWRDRYSASRDRWDLRIHGIGQVKIEADDIVEVRVELINNKYGNRWAIFHFEKVEQKDKPAQLSDEQQEKFKDQVEAEIEKIMARLNESWNLKPKMLASYPAGITMPRGTPAYVPYRAPHLKEKIVRADIGIAAWVTEEQIDHRESTPQMRYELYVMKFGKNPRVVLEDHSYEYEGSAVIAIVSLEADKVVANTRHGKKVIDLS